MPFQAAQAKLAANGRFHGDLEIWKWGRCVFCDIYNLQRVKHFGSLLGQGMKCTEPGGLVSSAVPPAWMGSPHPELRAVGMSPPPPGRAVLP